jgi:hypothetical protein
VTATERAEIADYARHFSLEDRVDEIIAFRARLADAYAAARLRTSDLYLTDAAVAYIQDPAHYGVDPLRTFVLLEQHRQMLYTSECDAETQKREAIEDEICAARGEPPPVRFTAEERAELQQKLRRLIKAGKKR